MPGWPREAVFTARQGRNIWLHLARGALNVNDERLEAGDGVAVTAMGELKLGHGESAEVLLFDMASEPERDKL